MLEVQQGKLCLTLYVLVFKQWGRKTIASTENTIMLYYSEAFSKEFTNPIIGNTYTAKFEIPYKPFTEYDICIALFAHGLGGTWSLGSRKWIVRTTEIYPDVTRGLSGTVSPYDQWSCHDNGIYMDFLDPAIVKPESVDKLCFHVLVPVKVSSSTTVTEVNIVCKYIMNDYKSAHS